MLKDLILANRSYRRFYENEPVGKATLRELVDCARLSASAMNLQPLRFIAVCSPEKRAGVFPLLRWAGYLKGWGGPAEESGRRPISSRFTIRA
jgi:nitroreductase